MKKYFRVMLGSGSKYAQECIDHGFVGIDFGFNESLKPYMVGTWSDHKDSLKEAFIKYNPDKTPVGLGLCTGALSNFGSWIEVGDIVLRQVLLRANMNMFLVKFCLIGAKLIGSPPLFLEVSYLNQCRIQLRVQIH